MAEVKFTDNSIEVKNAIEKACLSWLEEASAELESQTARRQTRVDTGATKGGWTHKVDKSAKKATVGNPLENSIWEEFGTGEYALKGGGRKGGWRYQDARGDWHFTRGKTPLRPLYKAYKANKAKIQKAFQAKLGGLK